MASTDPNYGDIVGESTDSLFYFDQGGDLGRLRLLLKDEDDGEVFFPQLCTKLYSSTMGLLLYEPYHVFNPWSAESLDRPIPTPPRHHLDHLPRALLVYKNQASTGHHVFHVVCALPSTNPLYPPGVAHAFDVYSSNTDQWHLSSDHIVGRIRAETNVSCGTRAYWLTETPSIACYDVADGSVDILPVPLKFWESGVQYHFQLGQWDVDLCFMVATEEEVEVYTLVSGRQWTYSLLYQFPNRMPAIIPIRFQSKKLQLVFLVVDHFVLISTPWDLDEPVSSDLLQDFIYDLQSSEIPISVGDVLPLVMTDLDPYEDFPTDPN